MHRELLITTDTAKKMVHPGGLLGCASPCGAVAEATLFSLVLAVISQTMKQQFCCYLGEDGASGRIRTSDRSVRSRVLYPAELRMHRELLFTTDTAKKMVHPGGFEPPTARFVAEYSIQLSYGCKWR